MIDQKNQLPLAHQIWSATPGQRQVALTFDAEFKEPQPQTSAINELQLLATLAKYNVQSTFFIAGNWAKRFPAIVKQIHLAGHEIGNHSYHHQDLTRLSQTEIIADLQQADQTLIQLTGTSSQPYFRCPYLNWQQETLQAIAAAGFSTDVSTSLDSFDWKEEPHTVITERILSQIKDGDIVLMHAWVNELTQVIDILIPELTKRQLTAVTLSQLLQSNPERVET